VETDPSALTYVEVSAEIEVTVVGGRICEMVLREAVFFEGKQLMGQDINEVAYLLLVGEPPTERSILPDGSELAIIAGRRHDYDLEVWGRDGLVTSVHLQDYSWIEG